MHLATLYSPLLIPMMPLLAAILVKVAPGKDHRIAPTCAWLSLAITLLLLIIPSTPIALVKLDALTTAMTLMVSFLGAVVIRFAARYLEGDPSRPRFLVWMSLTMASVLTLVISRHLLLITGAWVATSLCLNQLLLHHPNRPAAVFAARKKFVFSRIAEVFLLIAAILLYRGHGTWNIDELARSVQSGCHAFLAPAALMMAFCAMLKSAQFPFHSWLPDTMDTPTPVSAFMHAGIVNAGGFLVLRLAPVFVEAPYTLHLLAGVGSVTAAFGAIVMLVQPGVKRALAFSTIAQMGFMMIQCGLGAWGLALLHLLAHSLYKAHAFLHAGSTIGTSPRSAVPLASPALAIGLMAGSTLVAMAVTTLHLLPSSGSSVPFAFHIVLALAIAYGIGRAWSAYRGSLFRAFIAACAIAAISMLLHFAAGNILNEMPVYQAPMWLNVWVVVIFVSLFLFQSMLWRASAHPLGRKLYVHALNGFYVGTIANRLLGRLWPSRYQS